jgi:hypothetical protein
MTDQPIKVGDRKRHLVIDYCFCGEDLHCPYCGEELYRHDAYANQQPKRGSCQHLLYFWEKTRFGGHFFFVRPDFGKDFIQALLKSDYYEKFLQNPHRNHPHVNHPSLHHPRPLKDNEIGLFASGDFSSEDPMFERSNIMHSDPKYIEKRRFEEIGARVGNISSECPSTRHPEYLPDDIVVYYNFEHVGVSELGDSRQRHIALVPTEYHKPGVHDLSER